MAKEVAGYLHGRMANLRECGRSDMIAEPRKAWIGRDIVEGEGESENEE
jgi:hypothetical protein